MKKRAWLLLTAVLLMPGITTAQNVFDGTWKVDLGTAKFPEKPDEFLLKDGTYHCKTCVPPIDLKADGQDQKVSGYPYFDAMSVKVIDANAVEFAMKRNGKTVVSAKGRVSEDGKTLTFESIDSSATNAEPVSSKGSETRISKGPAGSHAISGSWKMAKMDTVSDNGLVFTYKVTGDSLKMTSPTGQGYTAKMDGTEAPYEGDPRTTSVSLKKTGPNTLEETDKRDGKVISVSVMMVSADGKTMKIANEDKVHGTHSEITAIKQ